MKKEKQPLLFNDIKVSKNRSILTTNPKFNAFFSRFGGMVCKSVIFVTGTSGAGKTTTLVNLMEWTPDVDSVFYARECDLDEIKDQIRPFEVTNEKAFFADEKVFSHFDNFLTYLEEKKPLIVMVDSLQAIADADFPDMNSDKAAAYIRLKLTQYIKKRKGVLFLIGHNTKEGEFAGKNKNMQMVDAHMVLEYDKKSGIRKIYWGQKNRKGPMTSMYYEIKDGQIVYFNPEEYQIPEVELNSSDLKFPKVFNPKTMFKLFVEQFKSNPKYEWIKQVSEEYCTATLKSYKKNYNNEYGESHAYFNAIQYVHSLAVKEGLIIL